MKERIAWIDWAKYIGIIMVVYAHVPNARLATILFLFHMPFFFMISGYLYKPRGFRDELLNTFKRLFLPYLIYNTVLIIITPPAGGLVNGFVDILIGNQEQLPPNYRAMWFLVSLMLMRCVSSLAPSKMLTIAICSLLFVVVLKEYGFVRKDYDAFQLNTTMMSYHYFVIGYFLKRYPHLNVLTRFSSKKNYAIILFLSVMLIVLGVYYVGFANLFRCSVGDNILLFLVVSYLLSYLMIRFIQITLKKESKIVKLISDGTLLIVCTHQTLLLVCNIINVDPFILPFLITSFILFISFFAIKISNMYMPILLGKSYIPRK